MGAGRRKIGRKYAEIRRYENQEDGASPKQHNNLQRGSLRDSKGRGHRAERCSSDARSHHASRFGGGPSGAPRRANPAHRAVPPRYTTVFMGVSRRPHGTRRDAYSGGGAAGNRSNRVSGKAPSRVTEPFP